MIACIKLDQDTILTWAIALIGGVSIVVGLGIIITCIVVWLIGGPR